jgi:CPA2 family monovalent cation:H+ antiporter-2
MLAPGGEFAFIIIAAAIAAKATPAAVGADVTVAVTLSMFAVPALGALAQKLFRPLVAAEPVEPLPPLEREQAHDAIIVGYGRVGRLVAEMLHAHSLRYLAVDTDAALVRRFRSDGVDIYWGNASRAEFLTRCGLAKAKALIITMDRPSLAEQIVRIARAEYPHLTIVARARDAHHATLLYELGVTDAVPETIEASLQLSEAVLVEMGVPMGLVIASIHEKRDEFRKILQPVALRAEARRARKLSLRMKEMSKRRPKSVADDEIP